MVSAVSPRGGLHLTFAGRVSPDGFTVHLNLLLHDIPGKIFLVLDGHSAHKSARTRAFVESTRGRLSLFHLPPHSPELNPDEWIWHDIKHGRVGKVAARTLERGDEGRDREGS